MLSICVPTFNRARYLDCLLQDLAAHVGELGFSYELLIGDNASEDDTADVVRRYEDQLAIRYIRRPENVGAYHNQSQLFEAAQGRYVAYVADDDLLIPGVLGRYIAHLEAHPDVGAVYAPWFLHDRVAGRDFDQFYAIEQETRIEAKDHAALFALLVNGHIFPEVYLARTFLARELAGAANPFAFIFFVRIAAMLDRAAVTFSPEPFYRQVIRYFDDESRTQLGHEEVKEGWDRYRGGLEYILARFASLQSAEDLDWCQRAIDRFVRIRMHVGLRLRTDEGKDWIDNYYIANRLRCTGDDSLLPAPYETYRINAALEYLLGLQPFQPERATVAYYQDDAPRILALARGFAAAGLVVLEDRSLPLPENVILLASRGPVPANSAAFVITEAELLSRFPGAAHDRDPLLPEIVPDVGDTRWVFHLAQSYFDAGDFVNARKWYAQRAEMGGCAEEVYYSLNRVAQAMANLGAPWPDIQDAHLRAWEFRPTRAEPLYEIAVHYRVETEYRLGYLFAERAAAIPLPEEDILFVFADIYAWRATDEQAVCAFWIGKHAEAFTLCRRLLARPDIPAERRQGIASNRDFSVPAMIEAASAYPDALASSLGAGPRDAEVTVSLVAGPDRETTEQTLNSFLRCCTDLSRVGRFVVAGGGLSAHDRAALLKRYSFLEFADRGPGNGPGAQLAQVRAQIGGRFWLHLGRGWRFFAPENYITRLSAVLDAEPEVFQVGINYGDAVKLTNTCAAEQEVRRTPDAGRYVLADQVASGPAMFDTTRLDRAGGLKDTDSDPIAQLKQRSGTAGLTTASLDEVLCITAC
ncbi:glycosyltransferase family A protein [Mycobacterium sp.]|uniref:glycosyltransferase family 2 protein n=1 Tax=Mycobacterium sp. TaxID=1785 RepID=UPI0031E3F82C